MQGRGSRTKLTPSHARLFPSQTLHDQLGRAICAAGCLPRKEMYEAWEVATQVREALGPLRGRRVVELACGFGLVATALLLRAHVEDGDAVDTLAAAAVDVRLPQNHERVHEAVLAAFPWLSGRQAFVTQRLEDFSLGSDDVVVSAHACGGLSDAVLARAVDVGAAVAVLPCCHQWRFRDDLRDVVDKAKAIDDARAAVLAERGYDVVVTSIPHEVSHKNRLIIGRMAE